VGAHSGDLNDPYTWDTCLAVVCYAAAAGTPVRFRVTSDNGAIGYSGWSTWSARSLSQCP